MTGEVYVAVLGLLFSLTGIGAVTAFVTKFFRGAGGGFQ